MAKIQHINLQFPLKGLVKTTAYATQPKLTSPDVKNVRVFDNNAERARGGQRPGTKKYTTQLFTGESTGKTFQALGHGVEVSSATSGYERSPVFFCVVSGTVYASNSNTSLVAVDTVGSTANASMRSDTTDVRFVVASDDGEGIGGSDPVRYAFFVDGRVYAKLRLKKGSYTTADYTEWAASPGTLPIASTERARLIALWRNRVGLSGVAGEDQNWYMSAVSDPEDWDYAPATTVATQAVAGHNADAGELGDVITSIFPMNADYLFFGGDQSLWVMRGDPMCGGQLDRITDGIGVAWGDSMAKDPFGNLYWYGSDGGIYMLRAGVLFSPNKLSQNRIDADLRNVNLAQNRIRLKWNTREQGLHVFISPFTSGAASHYFWDQRTDSWWKDVLPNAHGPLAVHMLDGDDPNDRVMIYGGHDGYIRQFDLGSDDDDGTAIDSYAFYTPVVLNDMQNAKLMRMTATPGGSSDRVDYEVRVGDDAEAAVSTTTGTTSGTWTVSGRQSDVRSRARGKVMSIKLGNDTDDSEWSMERLSIEVQPVGRVRV